MKRPSSIALFVLVLGIGITAPTANAVIIHVFTGPITEESILFPDVQLGDPFTAILRYEPTQVPVVIGSAVGPILRRG